MTSPRLNAKRPGNSTRHDKSVSPRRSNKIDNPALCSCTDFPGSARASRAHFGALAEMRSLQLKYSESQKVREREARALPGNTLTSASTFAEHSAHSRNIIAGELDAVDTTTYFRRYDSKPTIEQRDFRRRENENENGVKMKMGSHLNIQHFSA